ncbi:MAG: hypothetical protein V9H69_21415 [Anaerolineae bacterium]
MAHGGQELALGAVGGFGGLFGLKQRGLGLHAFGDILHMGDEISGLPFLIAHQRRGNLAIDDVPIAMAIAFCEDGAGRVAADSAIDEPRADLLVFRQRQRIDVHASHFLLAIAPNRRHLGIDLDQVALEVDQTHARVGVVEGQPEPQLAFSQRILSRFRAR